MDALKIEKTILEVTTEARGRRPHLMMIRMVLREHLTGASCTEKFSGNRTHRIIRGRSLSQEAPQAFADALVEVDGY